MAEISHFSVYKVLASTQLEGWFHLSTKLLVFIVPTGFSHLSKSLKSNVAPIANQW